MAMGLAMRDRLSFGATARGFQQADADHSVRGSDAPWPRLFVAASGFELEIGPRASLRVMGSEGKWRRATSRETYFLAQDGDLYFYNGLRLARRQGCISVEG